MTRTLGREKGECVKRLHAALLACVILVVSAYAITNGIQLLQQNFIHRVTIHGQGCESCFRFHALSLERQLCQLGDYIISIEEFDENATIHNDFFTTHDIPESLQGNVTVSLDERVFFIDYMPDHIIIDFLQRLQFKYSRLIVKQTSEDNYRIFEASGNIRECQIQNALDECLN
jgi:hypothetical protein